jgi:protein SCO1
MRAISFMLIAATVAAARAVSPESPKFCCAPDAKGPASAGPVSNRSIYQLESTWSEDAGQPMTLVALRGRPVIFAMFYTGCENACPIIVGEMKRIRDALPGTPRIRPLLVLVSFDSENDSPAVLHLYRGRMHLGDDCVLLHGQPDDVRDLAMLLGVKYARDSRGQFAHSNLISILNPAGEIVFQRPGLTGDISAAVQALSIASE